MAPLAFNCEVFTACRPVDVKQSVRRAMHTLCVGTLAAAALITSHWFHQTPSFLMCGADFVSRSMFIPRQGLCPWRRSDVHSRVALGVYKRRTSKVRMAMNIVQLRQMNHRQFSNKRFKKELERAKRVAEDDSWTNEFLSFSRPMASGGEYKMPISTAHDLLTEFYGAGSTIQNFRADEMSKEEFQTLDSMRRKAEPAERQGVQRRVSRIRTANIPGISKYVGSLPTEELSSSTGQLGVRGGSFSESYQDAWVSGGSIAYPLEGENF